MVLRPLPDRVAAWIMWPLMIATAPVWGLFVGLLAASVWFDRRFGPVAHFTAWFAWRPITTDYGFGETIWLEQVERARWYDRVIYRRLGDENVRPMMKEDCRP